MSIAAVVRDPVSGALGAFALGSDPGVGVARLGCRGGGGAVVTLGRLQPFYPRLATDLLCLGYPAAVVLAGLHAHDENWFGAVHQERSVAVVDRVGTVAAYAGGAVVGADVRRGPGWCLIADGADAGSPAADAVALVLSAAAVIGAEAVAASAGSAAGDDGTADPGEQLPDRLRAAMAQAREAGGAGRWRSAAVRVVEAPWQRTAEDGVLLDVRVDLADEPIQAVEAVAQAFA
jgi:uncharacterized Ntn-hydrolase superfamily protein